MNSFPPAPHAPLNAVQYIFRKPTEPPKKEILVASGDSNVCCSKVAAIVVVLWDSQSVRAAVKMLLPFSPLQESLASKTAQSISSPLRINLWQIKHVF